MRTLKIIAIITAIIPFCIASLALTIIALGSIESAVYYNAESRSVSAAIARALGASGTYSINRIVSSSTGTGIPIFYCLCGQKSSCDVEAGKMAQSLSYSIPNHNFGRPYVYGVSGVRLFYKDRVVPVLYQSLVSDEYDTFCGDNIHFEHTPAGEKYYDQFKRYESQKK